MQNIKIKFHLPSIVFIILSVSLLFINIKSYAQSNGMNFSISTNNLYFPGDEIRLNLYTYNYAEDSKSRKKAEFNFGIFKVKDINAFYSRQKSRYNLDVLSRDSMNLLQMTEEVYSFKKYFKQTNDYNYFYINESVPLNIKSRGAYIVKVTSGNKVAYCGFVVSSLGIISKAGINSMLAFVADRKTGIPVNDAEVSFFIGRKQIGSGKTSDGLFYQTVTNSDINPLDSDPLITGKYNDDIVLSDQYLYFGYNENRYTSFIYTEQPVYRTNSEVNFKGILRETKFSEYIPLKDKEITVIIKDPKGAEVYKELRKTNSLGSFDGKYKIDEESAIGDYTIFVNIEDKSSYSKTFTVEQFKKPEYKVTVTTDRNQYYGKDLLKAEVKADYFFGSPVTNAEIEYNIYKIRYYRPWWLYSEYSWWYEDYYKESEDNFSGAEFIFSGKGTLSSEGKFEIDYQLNEEFKDNNNHDYFYRPYYTNSDYKYIVQAKVTDNSRREISGTSTVLVTRGGFSLSSKTDKYLYKPGENVIIEVAAMDFSEKPVQTNFEASIYKSTWSRNDYKEKKDFIKTIYGRTLSDGKGMITFETGDKDAEGAYSAEIKARDERNNEITASAYFYVSDGDMWWYNNQSVAVQIITDKESYRQGDICKAIINITNPGSSILLTTSTDDIIFYRVVKFEKNSAIVDIPVTDKYLSNFEINVNYISEGVFYNTSKQVLVIPEQKFLTVQIEPSKLIYKPKEEGELKIRVLDNAGLPVRNAEVSIGIVDESIYSIKEDNTKDIRKFFYGNKNSSVSTAYNTSNTSNGTSRLITIYEVFNLKSTDEKNLATVEGRLLRKNGTPISNAIIVVNEIYQAAVTDSEGNFEFNLPEGKFTIGAYYGKMEKDDLTEIILVKGQTKKVIIYNEKELNYDDGTANEQNVRVTDGAVLNAPETAEMRANVKGDKKKEAFKMSDEKDMDFTNPDIRSDFRDAIYWSPYSVTDDDGYAIVSVKYPDNLTTWRITSKVITEDTKVGQFASTVITRKDLLVRIETPRFFQKGDVVNISTIVHNYLNEAKEVKLKFSSSNLTLLEEKSENTFSVRSDSEIRKDWKVRVDEPSGEAVVYAEALTNEESDAVEIKVPLQPRGLKMEVNSIADISEDIKTESKYIILPDNTDLRSTKFKFTADPSLASTILTALDELAGYPYGCVEQTMSRFLPTVVVAAAFTQLNAPISEVTKKELPLMIDKGLKRLYGFQHSDGGWGWWENDQTNPFMTAYVVYGLSIAKQSGYEINEGSLRKGISSIKNQLSNTSIDGTTRSYMLYTLAVANEKDGDLFGKNIEKIIASDINNYSRSLIALTWKLIGNEDKALSELKMLEKNAMMSGEGAAYWEGKEFHYTWQNDKVQTTAMALKAIININDKSQLKDKVIRWLMMQRQGMSWRNTQETAIVIYSIVDYLKQSDELNPDYTVRIYLNGENILEKRFTSGDVFLKSHVLNIENKNIKSGQNEIRIEKSGSGKLYFSSYMTYFSDKEKLESKEDGFRIEREYFKLEKYDSYSEQKITYRKKYFDGNVKSGDEILVKLKVYTKESDNQYFMLEDQLPSGVEVIKDDWAYQIEDENNFRGYPNYYWRWWFADKEVRDNKVVFFATSLGKGEYEFSYMIQAQIPGEYTVNPAKGMLMYYPEIFGSTKNFSLKIAE